jgi:hypothetical protein
MNTTTIIPETVVTSRDLEAMLPDYAEEERVTVVGNLIVFVRIDYDQHVDNPLEDWDGMGSVHSFSRRHGTFMDPYEAREMMAEDPDIVPLSYYEHGQSAWFVADSETPAGVEFQWDGVRFAGIWVPGDDIKEEMKELDHKERNARMRERAKGACSAYTDYINGNVYGYTIDAYPVRRSDDNEVYDREEDYRFQDTLFEDSCWGFFGENDNAAYMRGEMTETLRAGLQEQGTAVEAEAP